MVKFPSFVDAQKHKGGFNKWVYDMIKIGVNPQKISEVKVIVKDINKNPLQGVSVKLTCNEETLTPVETDSNGVATFTNVTEDVYGVECTKTSYVTFNKSFVLSKDNNKVKVYIKSSA